MLRDAMTYDSSRDVSQSYLERRLAIEREHARPGEVVMIGDTLAPQKQAKIRGLLSEGIEREVTTPDNSDPVEALHDFGLPVRVCNLLRSSGCETIGQTRQCLRTGEIREWRNSGEITCTQIARALKRADENHGLTEGRGQSQ